MNDFTYQNPTRIHFGKTALSHLPSELARFGRQVVLVYGTGSVKRSGLYDRVVRELETAGKEVTEVAGVPSNPTYAKVLEGCEAVRRAKADLILAVGGGSVVDCSKMISASAYLEDDPWEHYIEKGLPLCEKTVPIGVILTMAGTGSEMNAGAVITNHKAKLKIGHVFADEKIMPRFSILNPNYTMTLPKYQMCAGIYDIFNHICEQYFSGEDDNTSDYISEGLMRSVIHSSLIANENPQDYEARSNIMWSATWALNTLVSKGKSTDWMVHMLGQAVGGYTNATHGMTLAAVSLPYYRFIMPYGLSKFKRFAENVWNVSPENKTDEQIASEGLSAMENWMKKLGLVMHIGEFGVTDSDAEKIADLVLPMNGGYKALNRDEIVKVLKESI